MITALFVIIFIEFAKYFSYVIVKPLATTSSKAKTCKLNKDKMR